MLRVTEIAHLIVRSRVDAGAIAVDATVGNGHDTMILAACVGLRGQVFGFDVQADALLRTRARVAGAQVCDGRVILFHAGHEHMTRLLAAEVHGRLAVVMFNLGYLPGAAKHAITTTETTISAVSQAVSLLAVGGIVTIIVYRGHVGGVEEADGVRRSIAALSSDFSVHSIARLDSATSAPELLIVERLR